MTTRFAKLLEMLLRLQPPFLHLKLRSEPPATAESAFPMSKNNEQRTPGGATKFWEPCP